MTKLIWTKGQLRRACFVLGGSKCLKNPPARDRLTSSRECDMDNDDVDDLGDSDFSGDSDLDEEGVDDDRLGDDFTLAG